MSDLPSNTMGIIVTCSENGEMDVMVGHNFKPDFDEKAVQDFELILEGMNYFMKYQTEMLHQIGDMTYLAAQALDSQESEMMVEFEADKALNDRVKKGSNVVKFPNRKMH